MNFTLQTTRKISLSAFILSVCLLSVQTVFSQKTWDGGAGTNAWSDAANWSGNTIPAASEDVTIAEGQDVRVTTGTANCRKLIINGSAGGGQGKVTVNSGAVLTVTATDETNVPTGATNAALILFGGIVENNGVMTVTGRQNLDAMRFDNPTSGTVNSTYSGSGTLTCHTATAASTGSSTANGTSMTFAQTTGTATFTLATTGTYTFTVFSSTSATKTNFYCPKGTVVFNGTGTIGAAPALPTATNGAEVRPIRVAPDATGVAASLTIESGVTLNFNAIPSITFTALVAVENTFASATSSITNKGTINFGSTRGNPIGLNNGTNATNTSNFTNEGTININGAYSTGVANTTFGGIYMAGTNTTVGNSFTNTSTGIINFNTTTAGTSIKPLFFCSTAPKNLITNNGTITVGTNANVTTPPSAPHITFRLGDEKTTVNNTGTIKIGKGYIAGTAGTNNAAFNNNTGGTLNFELAAVDTTLSGNLTFTNAGGTLKGSGTFRNTGGNAFNSGTIAPGQSPGKIVLTGSSTTLNGTFNAEIDGTAGAGVAGGHDQIEASTSTATVNVSGLTIATTFAGGYTPANGHTIVLINTNSGTITGTPTYSPALAAQWVRTTTGGQVKITYDASVMPVELMTFKATPLSKTNLLTWETASETNNKGFDVQRKTAAGAWETLGFVNGMGKAATYTFEDKTPLSISNYRLRQVDVDGTETLSKVVSVTQNTKGRISITPNPTSDKVNINLNQNDVSDLKATLTLFDMTGRQVLSQITTGETYQLDLSNLAKGMYVLTVQSNNAVYQEKIIRQ
jgi:hypothetical protein